MPKDRSWPEQQGEIFLDRLADWLRLRGEIALHERSAPKGSGRENDRYEAEDEDLQQRLDDAVRLVMTTHAPRAWMVWRKFEILEAAVCAEECDPRWRDFRQVWMIAAIKADLASLGIRDPAD